MAQRSRGAADSARSAAHTGTAPDTRRRQRAQPVARTGPDLPTLRTRLTAIVAPMVVEAGLDLEDLVVSRAGRRHVVRVVVDGDGGVGHDELSDLSRRISAELDAVESAEPTSGLGKVESYTLEVSSPGVERPLTLPRHWRRNVGRLVRVKAGGRALTGRVVAADDASVTLEVDGQLETFGFDQVGPGHVEVEFGRLADLADEDFSGEIVDDDEEGVDDGGLGR